MANPVANGPTAGRTLGSQLGEVVGGALHDFEVSWRTLAMTDLAYKALAFAVLTPAAALLVRWLITRSGEEVIADTDIARFLLATPVGIAALLVTVVIAVGIAALEAGCLMIVGLSASRGTRIRTRSALAFGIHNLLSILRLTAHMALRAAISLLPFAAAIAVVYLGLLSAHDINYYLARKPPEFIVAIGVAAAVVLAWTVLVIRTIVRWTLALPLLLFEDLDPRHALKESAQRSKGTGVLIAVSLTLWAATAIVLAVASAWFLAMLVRNAALHLAGSAASLIVFVASIAILWGGLALLIGVIDFALFALLVTRLWIHSGRSTEVRLADESELATIVHRFSRPLALTGAVPAVLLAAGFAMLAFTVTRRNEKVVVLAHRGSSVAAPENTLAAFRLAVAERADFVELDVQESKDGVVLVVHDSDLMKTGRSPMKIWEHTAAELRSVDIGSGTATRFSGECVPTLAEALEVIRGSQSKMMIELKSYGHGERLEERVIDVVERSGMANRCEFMSLDRRMVARMKALRPSWRTGLVFAKAIGDPTKLPGDFLAVDMRTATPRLIRRAHAQHRDVYVWTVDDAASMLAVAGRGADGLISNKPLLARQVMERRSRMSDAQRSAVALLLRSGARVEGIENDGAARP